MTLSSVHASQSEFIQQLIEKAKIFCESFDNYRVLLQQYEELAFYNDIPPNPFDERKRKRQKKNNPKENKEKIDASLIAVREVYQEVFSHPFRRVLHKQPNYQQALACYKKKLFSFNEESIETNMGDQMQFDGFIAKNFASYQFFSIEREHIIFWKKSRLAKIKKLAEALKKEITDIPLFDDDFQQRRIVLDLDCLTNIETAPKFMPMRRHAKVARELLIKTLAMGIYDLHYTKMARYKSKSPYEESDEPKKNLTLNTSFVDTITHLVSMVDAHISERRVASVITKIKSEIQKKHPLLF